MFYLCSQKCMSFVQYVLSGHTFSAFFLFSENVMRRRWSQMPDRPELILHLSPATVFSWLELPVPNFITALADIDWWSPLPWEQCESTGMIQEMCSTYQTWKSRPGTVKPLILQTFIIQILTVVMSLLPDGVGNRGYGAVGTELCCRW